MLASCRIIAVLLCLLLAPIAADAGATREEVEVRRVVDAFAAAWNAHDMDRFAHLFTADATWVNVRGNRWVGAGQIKENHVAVHERFYGDSHLALTEVSIRFAAPTVAIVHARETITGDTVPPAAGLGADSQLSLVVVNIDGRWLIANGHNTNRARVAPRQD